MSIDADKKDVIASILNQNFVPIVDGSNPKSLHNLYTGEGNLYTLFMNFVV